MEDDAPLVRVMPRRPLYGINGFSTRIDIAVLSAIADEGWCATAAAIAADIDCKEVRLGVMVIRRAGRGAEGLIEASGRLLLPVPVPPNVEGLVGFKRLATTAARERCPEARSVELAGYLNDDHVEELRHVFLLVYRAVVPPTTAAPAGMSWLDRQSLERPGGDALSQRVLAAVG